MSNANESRPAAPFTRKPEYQHQECGLTKREHFAAMAMQAIASNHMLVDILCPASASHCAGVAVELADALLIEIDKQNECNQNK